MKPDTFVLYGEPSGSTFRSFLDLSERVDLYSLLLHKVERLIHHRHLAPMEIIRYSIRGGIVLANDDLAIQHLNLPTSSPLSWLRAAVRLVGRFKVHVMAFLMNSDTRQHVPFGGIRLLRAVLVRQGNCAKSDPDQLRLIEEPTDPSISSIGHLLDTITLLANNVLIFKRPRRDSNPCYRRERAMAAGTPAKTLVRSSSAPLPRPL